MTDLQYQILDELYFVTAFTTLKQETGLSEEVLLKELEGMSEAGWIKTFFPDPDQEIRLSQHEWNEKASGCLFLASKSGLKIHNGRG